MSFLRVYSGDALRDTIELTSDRFTIGRSKDNDLVLDSSGVSSHHATIVREDETYFVEDNNSTNGVFVNKARVQRSELKYWDEIQVYDYVLKFMALSGLAGDRDPSAPEAGAATEEDKTVVVDLSDDDRREKLRSKKKTARVVVFGRGGSGDVVSFQGPALRIGKSKACDIRTGGWFAPAVAAELERGADAYYLNPGPRGKVILNGAKVTERTEINDGDQIEVRGLRLAFQHRVESGA